MDNTTVLARSNITILTPVRNEELALPRYRAAVENTLFSNSDIDFRVLFIEDGSIDESWRVITEFCADNSRFEAIRFSRNFGVHVALAAGFLHARGDAVAVLACDLQDPPAVILDFVARWRAGAKIVFGRRQTRADPGWRIATSGCFEWLLRRFAMPPGSRFTTGSFLLADRKVVDCYRQFQEHNRITFALVAWTGFEQAVVDYDRQARISGKSGWSLGQMLKTFYDAFIAFSYVPVRMISAIGITVFLISISLAAYSVYCWVVGHPVPGWSSTMTILGAFFGVQFFLMSLVGEYLFRMYAELVRRPLYFVSDHIGVEASGSRGN